MPSDKEILETLRDAGCDEAEIESILTCFANGHFKKAEKMIAQCRKRLLDKLHESQACIDRIDYLSYRMMKGLDNKAV